MAETLTAQTARTRYATREQVKRQLGDLALADSSADAQIDDLLIVASRAIDAHCSRRFAREAVQEAVPGDGTQILMLSRTPVLQLTTLLYDNAPITDAVIDDA